MPPLNDPIHGRTAGAPDASGLVEILSELRAAGYRFATPTPATIARVNARPENRAAHDLAGVFGWSRPFAADLLPSGLLRRLADCGLLDKDGDRLRSRIRVSSLGGDLYAHSAYPTVASDAVFFGPDTYRFCSALQARLPIGPEPLGRAVDIGCGAGPGGLLVARHAPAADVILLDVNETALRFAGANAEAAGIRNVATVRSDLLSGVDGVFDLIVSNPPYLNDPLARAYRHGGGSLGAQLSIQIVERSLERLAAGGRLILYTGVAIVGGVDPFLGAVADRLGASGLSWTYGEVDPDVFGEELESPPYETVDRIAAVVLTVTRGR